MNISFKLSWNSRLHHRCIQIHFSIFGVDRAVTILLAARRVTSIGHHMRVMLRHCEFCIVSLLQITRGIGQMADDMLFKR